MVVALTRGDPHESYDARSLLSEMRSGRSAVATHPDGRRRRPETSGFSFFPRSSKAASPAFLALPAALLCPDKRDSGMAPSGRAFWGRRLVGCVHMQVNGRHSLLSKEN